MVRRVGAEWQVVRWPERVATSSAVDASIQRKEKKQAGVNAREADLTEYFKEHDFRVQTGRSAVGVLSAYVRQKLSLHVSLEAEAAFSERVPRRGGPAVELDDEASCSLRQALPKPPT